MELNEHQELAVTHDAGHVLVLAGAGTGKTRTIIARAAFLIQKGVPPWRILLLTFTRRAAKEMTQRLEQMIGPESGRVTAGTFHHFCLYTMRRMQGAFGIEGATVIDRDDQVQLMKLVRVSYLKKGVPFPRAAELVNLCSYARNTAQPIEDYLNRHTDYSGDMVEKISKISREYDQRKKDRGYLDYDDLLFRFSKYLHESKEIREKLRGLYDHILVDEMQDTNPLQWLILDGLRDPAKLFCVGDDAQSIYAFRGADFQNVHKFTKRIPGAGVLRLEENYRSTQGILDLANWLLSQSPLSYGKTLTAHRKTKSRPQLQEFDTDFDEARFIVTDLIERRQTGARWDDHMVITRTGNGARALESFLVEKKVPYRFVGGVSLLHAAHVKDLFSLIRAAASHRDELAWARYLTLWPRIGDVTAARLILAAQTAENVPDAVDILRDQLKNRPEIPDGILMVLDHWDSPQKIIDEAGRFLTPIMKRRYPNWDKRKQDFKLLKRLAERHRGIVAFLETYTLDPISSTGAERLEEEDVLTLTTAHSAKGAEARTCYLIRVEPGMYPHMRSLGDKNAEEEERRILYVAMTRAMDELIITRTHRFGGHFTGSYSTPGYHNTAESAYFLTDLEEPLVDGGGIHIDPDEFSDYDVITPWRRD